MSYRIVSFNMHKFHENTNKPGLNRLADIIKEKDIDIIAIQEIFSKGALDKFISYLGSNEWTGRWDTPKSKSASAAEGYAFAWRKSRIGLTKNQYGKDYEPKILAQYKMDKNLYKELLQRHIKNMEELDLPFQEKLIRNPYYARFTPADIPGGTFFELRIINAHIMFSKVKEKNEAEEKEEDDLSDVMMRRSEFSLLSHAVYPKVSNKDIDYLMEQTNAKYMPAYTILVGDYNLNLESYPKIDNEDMDFFIVDGVGKHSEYNPEGKKHIVTKLNEKTTIRRKDSLQLDPNDEKQRKRLTANDESLFYKSNYDHFTYDEIAFEALKIKKMERLFLVDEFYKEAETEDPFEHYRKFREEVSDHLPIMIEISTDKISGR